MRRNGKLRKILSGALVLLFLLTLLPGSVRAADIVASGECGAEGDNLTWTLDSEGVLTISGTGAMADFSSDGAPWYGSREMIHSVVLEGNVTSIGACAFNQCDSMMEVTIPNSVSSIGHSAFSGCSSLTEVMIPDSVTFIGEFAFSACSNLTEVSIPKQLNTIGEYAFAYCYSLTAAVMIPNSVTDIGEFAFLGCRRLTGISVENGNSAFRSEDGVLFTGDMTELITCPGGKQGDYVIPESVTKISSQAFCNCADITSVTIPAGVTIIGSQTFNGCWSLTGIYVENGNAAFCSEDGILFNRTMTDLVVYPWGRAGEYAIPDGVTRIMPCAFQGCRRLTDVTIPVGVTDIGIMAFNGCITLRNVYYGGTAEQWEQINISAYGNDELMNAALHLNGSTDPVLVASGIFGAQGDNLAWTLDSDGKLIISGSGAMQDFGEDQPWLDLHNRIRDVLIEPGVTEIGDGAFAYCYSLSSVAFPQSLTRIGSHSFLCCPLTEVVIPAGVTSIEMGAFAYCSSVSQYVVEENNPAYYAENGALFSGDGSTLVAWPAAGTGITDPSFDGITTIECYAFADAINLNSVRLPEGVTSIPFAAFYGCSGLTAVYLPSTVAEIGNIAFSGCTALTDVYFSERKEQWETVSVGDDNEDLFNATLHTDENAQPVIVASGECGAEGNNLTWTLNNRGLLTVSGSGAMENWADEDHWDGMNGQIKSVCLEPGVTTIGNRAFSTCSRLAEITIPDSMTEICDWAFEGCVRLKEVTIPNSVTRIGYYAFYGCSGLESITIPASVTGFEGGVFAFCTGLTDITVAADNPSLCSVDGVVFSKDRTKLIAYPIGRMGAYTVPEGVLSIGTDSFRGCVGLSDITIPGSVSVIEAMAFTACRGLSELVIPEGVTKIGRAAFQSCSGLGSLTLPNTVTELDGGVFNGCGSLTAILVSADHPALSSVDGVLFNRGKTKLIAYPAGKAGDCYTIPEGVAEIGEYAFQQCLNLKDVTIPSGVTRIGNWAFSFCFNLNSVTIPVGLTDIAEWAFFDCEGLTDVWYGDRAEKWDQISIGNNNDSLLNAALHTDENAQPVIVASGECGAEGNNLTWTLDSDGVLTISGSGDMAAWNSTGPWNDVIGNIRTVIIEPGVTGISSYAFLGCYKLTGVTIPASVTKVNSSSFWGCSSLASIIVDSGNAEFRSTDGVLFNNAGTELILYPAGKIGGYTVPNGVLRINDTAFSNCIGLTDVTIPASVTSIGMQPFFFCTGLREIRVEDGNSQYRSADGVLFNKAMTELIVCPGGKTGNYTIPDGVITIGNFAVQGCTRLSSVILPKSVTDIGYYAFQGNSGLTSITIPASVTVIHIWAFSGCERLADVYYGGTQTDWSQISIGESNTELTSATIHFTDPLDVTSVTADKTTAKPGDSLTWTAAATGGTGILRYNFYVYKDGAVIQKTGYTTANTVTWTAAEAGSYSVKVYVKDGAATVVTKTGGNVSVTAPAEPLAVTGVTVSKTTAKPGDSLTWTAAATGGTGTLRYNFYVYKDGAVIQKTGYTTANTVTWTATEAGSYSVKVYVKDGAATVVTKTGGNVSVTAPAEPLAVTGVTADKTTAKPGDSITWTAAASGGTGTLRYNFYIYKDGAIVQKTGYTTAKTAAYTAAEAGSYSVKVYVKDGAAAVVTKTGGSVSVGSSDALTVSSITASKTGAKVGDTVTWTASASGGSGSLRYCFYIYKDGTVIQKTGYTASKTVSCTVAEAGKYTVKVFVKDAAGTAVSKVSGACVVSAS